MTPVVLILSGIAIRLDAFLINYSISTDEASLARNIVDRSWTQLLTPLDYAQIAPPGFLFVQKAVVTALGSGERALRLFPLVCGVLSVCLCWVVARRILSPLAALCALGLFSFNNSLAQFSAVAKPYASDVTAALVILLVAVRLLDGTTTVRQAVWVGLAGAAAVLFSFPAVFVLTGVAMSCWLIVYRAGIQARRAIAIATGLWLAGAVSGAVIGQLALSPADSAYMKWFWSPGFMPFPPKSMEDTFWLWYQLKKIFRWTGQYRASAVWIGMGVLGAWSLRRRGRAEIAMALFAPLLLVIGASAWRLYPFAPGRLELFLLPMLLMLVAEGTDWCWRVSPRRLRWMGAISLIVIVGLAAQSAWSSFRERGNGDLRTSLQLVRNRWRAEDRMYVHYASGQVFMYYAPRLGFTIDDYVIGRCSNARRDPLREIDRLRGGPRIWVVALGEDRKAVFARYLDAIGTVRETRDITGLDEQDSFGDRGFVSLYDLTRSPQSALVEAETFPVEENASESGRYAWGCYGVFRSILNSPPNATK